MRNDVPIQNAEKIIICANIYNYATFAKNSVCKQKSLIRIIFFFVFYINAGLHEQFFNVLNCNGSII